MVPESRRRFDAVSLTEECIHVEGLHRAAGGIADRKTQSSAERVRGRGVVPRRRARSPRRRTNAGVPNG